MSPPRGYRNRAVDRWCRCLQATEVDRRRCFDGRGEDATAADRERMDRFGCSHGWYCADCGKILQEG